MLDNEIKKIEEIIGYTFKNKQFLITAFTHSSYGHLKNKEYNERQEFLGDSLLNLITTTYLYNNCDFSEGEMSKIRAHLVSCDNLSEVVSSLNLVGFLKVSSFNPHQSKNAMGDLFEALIAGIYLDSNYKTAESFVVKKLNFSKKLIEEVYNHLTDYKTKLQEIVQQNSNNKFEYVEVEKKGPAHMPTFTIAAVLNGEVVITKTGKNKKETENECAKFIIENNLI